jgi:AraC family transcriptional regulator, regulatory protein of adaptative response / methylated-DNA-[protein]-cysteine methyltransferase
MIDVDYASDMTTESVPDQITAVCRFIQANAAETLPLQLLADRVGLSRFHFQRLFKQWVGITPKQYQQACRRKHLKQELRRSENVTEAIYAAGFGSSSRVYENTDAQLGMTPKTYVCGAKNTSISHVAVETKLGWMMLAATDRGLCFLQFADAADSLLPMLRAEFPHATLTPLAVPYSSEFVGWIEALHGYLSRGKSTFLLPVDVQATAFQARVWDYLRRIPDGETRSYAQVADAIGQPKASRAVARACASNRIAIVIPCHRVIRGNGDVSSYRWGADRKSQLLRIEQDRS